MKENLKDILTNLNPEVDQETLLKYLQGKLSAEEQHEVEKSLVDDPFEADALEGLSAMENKQRITAMVAQLNRDLKKKTSRRNKWKLDRIVKLESWLLLAIVLILLLAVIGYLVIHQLNK
jgi:preprotein translocase subunit Sec63